MARQTKRKVGDAGPPFRGAIERVKLGEYARALHLTDPIYFDRDAAVKAGYRDVLAPPGYLNIFTLQPRAAKFDTFEVDEPNALAGEWGWEYFKDVCAGDELHGHSVLIELYEKKGKRDMIFMKIETRFLNEKEELVAIATDVTLEFKV